MRPRILVACVGNIFLGDDAFGIEVGRRLADRALGEAVQVVDFGIRGYDLAYALMENWDLVILVDAVPRGGSPGTVYLIEVDAGTADMKDIVPVVDAHSMNPAAVLRLVGMLGGDLKRMLVVGCEPSAATGDLEDTMQLSEPVRAAVDEAITLVEALVKKQLMAAGASVDAQ
jgi:hydrogenase maturation protease